MRTARRKFLAVFILCRGGESGGRGVAISDREFLLYPLDTGEDPVCLGRGSQMTVAGHEVRETKQDFISFRCPHCGRFEKFLLEE